MKIKDENTLEFFKSITDYHKLKINELEDYLTGKDILTESNKIDEKWRSIVCEHAKKNRALKLVILAEAPLKFNKYFYNRQGTFLDSLRDFWNLKKNTDLPLKMLENRVLLFDIYQYAIPSEFYAKDISYVLFDQEYVKNKIDFLKKNNLIDKTTLFVFRYKNLFNERKLHLRDPLKNLNILKQTNELICLNESEKPQKINNIIAQLLNN
jgi:hypothetical protein